MKLFIVDDDPLFRDRAKRVSNAEPGVDLVGAAASAEQAFLHLAATDVDLILMDINLPGVSGFTATRQLRQSGCDARIIFVTADPSRVDRAVATLAGGDGVVAKDEIHQVLHDAAQAAHPIEPLGR